MAIYNNLPGIFLDALDGQLTIYPDPGKPKFLILGTSDSVPSDYSAPYTVTSFADVKTGFGTNGTLYKTMVEAQAGGASNFVLWRIGDSDASDGTQGKRHQYQELFKAFAYMYDQPLDAVIPGGVYLDDANVMDLTDADAAHLCAGTSTFTIPAVGSGDVDTLGMFQAKEVAGEWKFAWVFPGDPGTPSFASPSVTLDPDSIGGTIDDFHEVNFAYQLAEFCHRGSEVVDMRMGFIGVKAAVDSAGAVDWGGAASESTWVGKAPTLSSGAITVDGTGLLGNKFLSGRLGAASGPPPFKNTATYAGNGGFFASAEDAATGRCYLDDAEKTDANGSKVDIGKYLNIVASWINFASGSLNYETSVAAAYGGFLQGGSLPVSSAPTNKSFNPGTLLGTITSLKLDALAGKRLVGLNRKATGVVISDGPTAATPASDYARASTVRQVEACVDGIRAVGEPFLGGSMTSAQIAGLDTAIKGALQALVQSGSISAYEHQIVVTPQMKILGQAIVQLKVVPAFELRQITVVVGLSAT